MRIGSYKQQQKKKSSLPLLVMTGMCAAVITIVGQSLSHPSSYHAQGYTGPNFSQDPIGQIEILIKKQQSWIDQYLQGMSGTSSSGSILQLDETVISDHHSVAPSGDGHPLSHTDSDTTIVTSGAVRYDTFETLKKQLAQQSCTYDTPVDNTNHRIAHIIERGLERCLITLSHTRKINASDHLTHRTMRIMAERAGFVVKQEHMSDTVVSRDRFYSFVYALQQHHQIGDLPVIPISSPVTRIEWLSLLYVIFGGIQTDTNISAIHSGDSTENKTPVGPPGTVSVAMFKSGLQSQGYDIQIMPYDDDILLTPEIMQHIMGIIQISTNKTNDHNTINHSNTIVGIDTTTIKQTLSRLIDKI